MKKIFIFGIIMLLALSSFVLAGERDPPHQFYGEVTTNGVAAEDGLLIIAKIDGTQVASTTTSGGSYGFNPNIFYVLDDASGREGDTIYFFVKDKSDVYQSGPSYDFINGRSTNLPIAVTGDFGSSPPAEETGGGGSTKRPSGGGGGGSIESTTTNESNATDVVVESDCNPDWSCSDWEDCIAGTQKRTCVDDNTCNPDNLASIEQKECELLTQEESLKQEEIGKKGPFGLITGAVIGGGVATWVSLLVLLGIVGLAIFLVYRKK